VGLRLALWHPERLAALVLQNTVAHGEGLGPLCDTRGAYWADQAANADKTKSNLLSFEAARQCHVGTSPYPERYDPDPWTDESAFLKRPGQERIQEALFFDYRTNVTSCTAWQAYPRDREPQLLALWGKYVPSFTVEGAHAYQRDVPQPQLHMLDAGHFALDEASAEMGELTRQFLTAHVLDSRVEERSGWVK
jgi:pimeloyl-ACP methyl ester carboxylesterase